MLGKKIAFKDACKHAKSEQMFTKPGIDDFDMEKVYENKHYVVYKCEKWGYDEILDKEKYGEDYYEWTKEFTRRDKMTQEQELKAARDVKFAEGAIEDLQRELNDKENSLGEKIDATIYIAIKLREKLSFIDEHYIKEIMETYEGK